MCPLNYIYNYNLTYIKIGRLASFTPLSYLAALTVLAPRLL